MADKSNWGKNALLRLVEEISRRDEQIKTQEILPFLQKEYKERNSMFKMQEEINRIMDFEIDPQPKDETDKEQMFDLFFNKEKILQRSELKLVLEKIKAVVEAIHTEPKKKEEEKKK